MLVLGVVAFCVVYPLLLVVVRSAPLATSANRPLSILQLDYIAERKFEAAVVVACIVMFISLAGALFARVLGLRSNVG